MATQRDRFRSYNYEDGGMSLDDLLMQIQQPQIEQPQIQQPQIQQAAAPVQAPAQPDKNTIINNLVGQIKARSNTSQWSGGYGADDATKDMARILAETGITDISQFGPITQEVQKIVGYEDWGDPIYQTVTEQTYGNKVTGQAVPNTYTTRQTGEFFGGTYEGKGNTGYGVQFDAQGQPIFYTQGASSADPIAKAVVPIASLALAAMGAPSMLGNTLLGAGANQVAAGALGGALIGGGTAALTDQDIAKGALLGGAGGALSGYLSGASSAEITAASDAAIDMADSGLSIAEINNQLEIAGYKPEVISSALKDATNIIASQPAPVSAPAIDQIVTPVVEPTIFTGVTPSAPLETIQISAPAVAPNISDVISAIVQQPTVTPVAQPLENVQISAPAPTPTPTVSDVISAIALQPTPVAQPVITPVVEPAPTPVEITTQRPSEPVAPNVLNAVNTALQTNVTQPLETVQITAEPEKPTTIANVISAISTPPEVVISTPAEKPQEEPPSIPLVMSPTAPTSVPTEPVKTEPEKEKEKSWTAAELAELARLGLLATTVLGAGQTGETGFPIVPIPSDWTSPIKPIGSKPFTPLTPIDFGSRELLRGTQWEKFLDPNYGKVPAPVQFNQPSNMSYDRLMSILGTGRDVMPSQLLTINDVISGIQNQYGQTTNSAMGQKPA
jgi:hypothetical protein